MKVSPFCVVPSAIASLLFMPALLGPISFHLGSVVLEEVGLIWISHIGLDRMLGYGLKYPTSFAFTHIQSADYAGPSPDR